LLAEGIPTRSPDSFIGRAKAGFLNHPVIVWMQLRDGWAVWADGGREGEWQRWKSEWDKKNRSVRKDKEVKKRH